MMPTVWCPGCGHGNIARAIATSLERLELDLGHVVVLGGIGCSGRTPFYFNTNAMHTTHGRVLAFATGLKLANPSLTVIVAMGDGDALAIGAGHFIHAARRNIDLTVVLYNNSIYGMTGGQQAPTTPRSFRSTTSPFGGIEPAFDAVDLALAAGATYVARTTTFDFAEMPEYISGGIRHPGFAMIEILSQCPTYFGRLNQLGDAPEMIEYQRNHTVMAGDESQIGRDDLLGNLPVGIFRQEIRPEYTHQYAELSQAQGGDYRA
jgi:2-oxoglutarate ferredoxin oxidoreductase subunit beta